MSGYEFAVSLNDSTEGLVSLDKEAMAFDVSELLVEARTPLKIKIKAGRCRSCLTNKIFLWNK